ncbi:Hypothetical predicted protein [Lecanosticta acicola]|uniref:Uncharacterized protein n=1 Tax=Lecanosticta acicola TaxID=111012 RepID=A0AAI8YU65_9PEZI|nr:Hypothetical predicted protein [Lecanosticta acicola]
MTAASQGAPQPPQSLLLALPRELRDEIYKLTFEDFIVDLDVKKVEGRNAGLCLASKQLYTESSKLYYEHSIFLSKNRYDCVKWLSKLAPSACAAIKTLRCDFVSLHPAEKLGSLAGFALGLASEIVAFQGRIERVPLPFSMEAV